MRVAKPIDFAFLQNAQKLGLQTQRHFADFIQQQRAAVGQLKFAGFRCGGSRERAAHMAEQFAFQQAFRKRGAVNGDERLVRARTEIVDHPRKQLFARTAFSFDQNIGFGLRHAARIGEQRAEIRARNRRIRGVLICSYEFRSENALHGLLELIERNRLHKVIAGAFFDGMNGFVHVSISGQEKSQAFAEPFGEFLASVASRRRPPCAYP